MLRLDTYNDADWAGCPDTHRSTTGWCVFLGDALISWKCKKQDRVSKSSIEAVYHAMSTTIPIPLHADNRSAILIVANSVFHERTNHIEVDCHSIHDTLERWVN
ncbi:uncharacterized mitochondrial protein AtMg00810-like [Aristolochia californica]|uniref:uncharacterized mitochondrial protein AtMg00810-like n=1 Tax=Aristolochia californica TaxID=171875 RepID=UPI0035DC3175